MTVGAEKPQIAWSVVEEIAIDMVDVEREWTTVPVLAHPAHGTFLGYSDGEERAVQQCTLGAPLGVRPCHEDEFGFDLLRIVLSLVVALACEVAGINAKMSEAPTDVMMRSTTPLDVEIAEDSGDAV